MMKVLNQKVDVDPMNSPTVVNLFGGPSTGKCFAENTLILMYDGSLKNAQDIVVGDVLMGDNSTGRTVLSLHSGVSEMHDIIPIKGAKFTVNPNHILVLKHKHHKDWENITCSVAEYLTFSKTKQERSKLLRTGVNFRKKNVNLPPYFVGCWLGDGTNADQSITISDNAILDYMYNYAKKLNMYLHKRSKKDLSAHAYYITNGRDGGKPNYILDKLRELNLLNNKHIPNIYKINSRKIRLELLAGLIDTDGDLSRNCFGITTKYKTLAEDILYLCRSLGLACYCSPCRKSCPRKDGTVFTGDYFRITISGDIVEVPVKLQYKKANIRRLNKNVLHTGFKIEPAGVQNYHGFETDGNHKFLLSDFTVVHNSTTAAAVFSLLKIHGVETELVTEFAKDLVWEERSLTFKNQHYLFGKQHHRLWRIGGKVDVMVTDSPIFLSVVYRKELYSDAFKKVVIEEFNAYNNINFFLNRTKAYNEVGRNQTQKEAKQIDREIIKDLDKHNINYYIVNVDISASNLIAEKVLHLFNKEIKYKLNTV